MTHIVQTNTHQKPDYNKDSRQIAVYGHQAQGKLMSMRVLLQGITGLGIQVAKNLVLAGPKQVSLYDQNIVNESDVGRNFYCKTEHIGKVSRSEACVEELKKLNPKIVVNVMNTDEIEYITQHFDMVVAMDNYNKDYLIKLNRACHKKGIGFIYAGNLGLYGFAFVDFGEAHRIFDPTGEEPLIIQIAAITNQEKALVYLHQKVKHGLSDTDYVVFREVQGMNQINGKTFQVKVETPEVFSIGDTRGFGAYVNGGMAVQVKQTKIIKSNDLQKSLRCPYPPESKEMPIASWEKLGVPEQLHIILNGLHIFFAKHGRISKILNEEDADELVKLVQEYLQNKMVIEGEEFKVENVDEKLIRNVSRYAEAQISPCSSFWGGIITQEIVKFTGKYTPIRQWLHHQFFEVLPEQEPKRVSLNNRYEDYMCLFGEEYFKKASGSSTFVIGAGALGCEFIKMFALMGLSSKGGQITVTDDDNIEMSNLNRQFLFREEHVKKNKSICACEAGKKMNQEINFVSKELKASSENEVVFNDQFWNNQTCIVNAVDNVKARQYIDKQCVWYGKPLFESGTLGTKCHSQIIIPHETVSYNDIQDPPEVSFPICTLKLFPYQIEHTIQWARDYFEGVFSESSLDLTNYFQDKSEYLTYLKKQNQNVSILLSKLKMIKKLYHANENKSFETCVDFTVNIFYEIFNHQIKNLTHAYPEDYISTETKKPYWSGTKRFPRAIQLNLNDPLQLELIQASSNIFATMFNIPMVHDKALIAKIAEKVKATEWVPQHVKVQTEQNKKQEEPMINENDEVLANGLISELLSYPIDAKNKPTPIEFEKDDPTNFHIEFLNGVANLRARNYSIEEVDSFKVKLIAGKIIPAIATTTAMVVGTVGIEIIKYLLGKKGNAFKNVTINLALPLWIFNQTSEAIVNQDKQFDYILQGPIRVFPSKFTKWQKIDLKGPLTLQDIIKDFQSKYPVKVSSLTYGSASVYASYSAESKKRLKMTVPAAIEILTKTEVEKWRRYLPLEINADTIEGGITCYFPTIRYEI